MPPFTRVTAPKRKHPNPGRARRCRPVVSLFVIIALLAPGMAQQERDPSKIGKGLNFFSTSQEVSMGQSYSNELNSKLELVRDREIASYVERMGQRLVGSSLRQDIQYHFFVVNTREVNAFALPGGYIYVNRGLIELADNEDELAGVLGHEIGHVVGKHSLKQMSKQLLLMGIAMGAGVAVGAKNEKWGKIVGALGGIGVFFAGLKFSRNDEREADWLGFEEMHKAGYNAWGMVTFFEKLEKESKGGHLPVFLNTHPFPAERKENMRREVAALNIRPASNPYSAQFADCRARFNGLPYPRKDQERTLSSALAALDNGAAGSGAGQGQTTAPTGNERQWRSRSREIAVPGNATWIDTGIDLEPGDRLAVTAEGTIQWKKGSEESCGPDGVPGKGFWKPISKANTAALLGKIGDSSVGYFVLGGRYQGNVLKAGRLFLGINDDNNFDNRGEFQVRVSVNQ